MTRFLETSLDEGRRAARTLIRTPLFTTCALALLTIAIGTVTALGAAGYELLHARLPYGSPHQLAMVWSDLTQAGYLRAPLSGLELADLRQRARSLTGIAAMFPRTITLVRDNERIQINMTEVTANLFDVLQVSPALGRTFVREDEGVGKPPTLILSWQTWQDRFGGDTSIIGRKIDVGRKERYEVIGVMPEAFRMVFPPDANIPSRTDVWLPFSQDLNSGSRTRYFLRLVARVREGTTMAAASEEVNAIRKSWEAQYSFYKTERTIYLVGLTRDLAEPVRISSTALLSVGVVLVLLVLVSLSGLWAARAVTQRNDQLIHQMLGASAGRVWAQLVAQALLIAMVGTALGLAAGMLGLAALRQIRPPSLMRIDHATLTAPVMLAVVALVAVVTLCLAALSRRELASMAGSDVARARVSSAPRYRTRTILVMAQVALALVFLVSSALWTRTLVNVLRIDAGFNPDQAVTFRYSIDGIPWESFEALNQLNLEMANALTGIPGVVAAGMISALPFDHLPNWAMPYTTDTAPDAPKRDADVRTVTPGFLKAIGGRLRAGRFFENTDDGNAPPVVVVDRLLAERTWPGQDPIGKSVRINMIAGQPPETRTVIGVVDHIRYRTIETQVREQIFLPHRQFGRGQLTFIVRTTGNPATLAPLIRSRVREVDARVPTWDVRPLREYYDEATADRRFTAGLMISFAAIALVLASIGVYGLLAYLVASRRMEFGVRLALGAENRQLVSGVLRESLQWGAIGAVVGGLAMTLSFSALSSALYGVAPSDPLSWGAAAVLLLVVVFLASWLPARRAGRTDPAMLMKSQ